MHALNIRFIGKSSVSRSAVANPIVNRRNETSKLILKSEILISRSLYPKAKSSIGNIPFPVICANFSIKTGTGNLKIAIKTPIIDAYKTGILKGSLRFDLPP